MKTRASYPTGTFLRIPLPDGRYGYGRVLSDPYLAFYAYSTSDLSDDLDMIESKSVLFRQAVRKRFAGRWTPIGVRKLEGEVATPTVRFTQDLSDLHKCTIFDSTGMKRSATPEECVGLECAAVWEPHHIEQRLLDTFMGRPNDTEVWMRVRLVETPER